MKTKVMTKAQKRVAIAKDVIKHLRSKFLRATSGSYFIARKRSGYFISGVHGEDLRDVLKQQSHVCEVCAKGAMFISHVMRFDGIKVSTYGDVDDEFSSNLRVCRPLLEYFSKAQLDSVERAFEGWDETIAYRTKGSPAEQEIYNKYRHEPARLIAIMRNIIKNKGTFKP